MLYSEATKHGSGLQLYGDYFDLRDLHETVSNLCLGAPLEPRFSGLVMGLAYDLRKAYEGFRDAKFFGLDGDTRCKYFGAKILWPMYLPQIGLLRWAAAYHSTSRADQANLLRLEHLAEHALMAFDPVVGGVAWGLLSLFNSGLPPDYLAQFLEEVAIRFCETPTRGNARFRSLPDFLRMLSPISAEYHEFKTMLEAKAVKHNCKPEHLELMMKEELPDFKW